MPVPNPPIPTSHRLLRWAFLWLLVVTVAPAARAAGPDHRSDQPLRLPLENLGFQPISPQFLLNGSSMFTVHYVDDKHLLLTFVVKRLIRRLPDEPADDMDRNVEAVLVEIPTGKALARTTWHLHDHAQYLWALGHGHFLLRIRDNLTTFAPLANLSTGQPFTEHPFLASQDRRIAAVIVSPDSDLLTIESIKRRDPEEKPKTPLFGPTPPPEQHLSQRDAVLIHFFRLHLTDDSTPAKPVFAGVVQSRQLGDIPASSAGYLDVVDQGRQHYAFDFHSYAGKKDELSPFDSACPPAPIFVSHSEFIAFGCRNSQARQIVGGFNMRGEEMWEQGLYGDYIAPHIAFAPAGGRFALSRILIRTSAIPDQPISADEVSSQTVIVYQTNTGKQLLRADCSPVSRAGQNFAFSPDGLSLAVIHADAIEIYNLPPLTSKDQAALKLAESSAPPETDLPIHFGNQSSDNTADAEIEPDIQSPTLPEAQPAAAANSATPTQPTIHSDAPSTTLQAEQPDVKSSPSAPKPATPAPATPESNTQSDSPADPDPGQRRAPPTLYNLPTDKDKTPATQKSIPQ
ncbi:MAG: hypothetical protein WDN23_03000 [Edaphobacter sp.]